MSDNMLLLDLGRQAYKESWDLQKKIQEKRISGKIDDTLILVEHPPVYTLGKNADQKNLIASEEYLQNQGITIYNIGRGGDITYHGPGQLVGYPIFNIRELGLGVKKYVHSVEEALIQMLAGYDISARRIEKMIGVWVKNKKIAAIGIRISRWVTMHGFALNVQTELAKFGGIIPCGIADKGITRMLDLNDDVKWQQVKKEVVANFQSVFGFENILKINQADI